MNRLLFYRLIAAFSLLTSTGTYASINLGFTPISQTVDQLEIGLFVTGLGDTTAPALSTYDLDIGFDPNHLAYSGIVFGDQLDVFSLAANITSAEVLDAGILNLFELSLDTAEDLNAWQSDSFVLATLSFNILHSGSSRLSIHVNAFDDATADPLSVTLQTVTITSVPIPSAIWMMLGGLGIFWRSRCQGKARHG